MQFEQWVVYILFEFKSKGLYLRPSLYLINLADIMSKNADYSIRVSTDLSTFGFTSVSDSKVIEKRVEYTNTYLKLNDIPIYNLGFGDVDDKGNIDDSADSNNGDIVKVMSAVALTIYEYTARYPDRYIYFSGSTEQRTKFYQTLLIRKYDELISDFYLYGVDELDGGKVELEEFDKNKNYEGFILIRKLN